MRFISSFKLTIFTVSARATAITSVAASSTTSAIFTFPPHANQIRKLGPLQTIIAAIQTIQITVTSLGVNQVFQNRKTFFTLKLQYKHEMN